MTPVTVLRLLCLTTVLAGPPGQGKTRTPAPLATVLRSLRVARWNLPLVPNGTTIGPVFVSMVYGLQEIQDGRGTSILLFGPITVCSVTLTVLELLIATTTLRSGLQDIRQWCSKQRVTLLCSRPKLVPEAQKACFPLREQTFLLWTR